MDTPIQVTDLSTQQVNMKYSGFWRRAIASLIDGTILIIPSLVFTYIIPIFGGMLLSLVYKPIFESSELMATPGKAIMGLRVVSEAGERLSLKQAFIRYVGTLLSGIIMGIGYLMNLFTEKKQTLHDIIAQTVVIDQLAPDLNYFQAWLTQIKKLFSETDSAFVSPASRSETVESTMTIEQLFKLYQSGALTEEEYNRKKSELLNKI